MRVGGSRRGFAIMFKRKGIRLARLILDDATSGTSTDTGESQAYLAKLIKDGVDSGPATPWTIDDVEQIRENVFSRPVNRVPKSFYAFIHDSHDKDVSL